MHVDPVVGEEVVAREDERNREEVAVREPAGRGERLRRRRRPHDLGQGAEREGGDRVGARDRLAAGLDRRDPPVLDVDPLDRRAGDDLAPEVLDPLGHGFPHLARAVARVVELADEALHAAVASAEERVPRGRAEREALDPLGGPFGADLRAGNAPDLLRVRSEEEVVEPPAEAVGHPFLQALLPSLPPRHGREVRGDAAARARPAPACARRRAPRAGSRGSARSSRSARAAVAGAAPRRAPPARGTRPPGSS